MESTLVIKAKCGDTLRRFSVPINENGLLDLTMSGLRAKILGLFEFPLDADLTLTYVDEDGDLVTLVDDDDLVDVMKQSLKFLRVDVLPKNDKFAKSSVKSSSGTSTPMRSSPVLSPLLNLNNGIGDVLKSTPQPLREALSKLSQDLASKAACSNSVIADLVDCLSKMSQSFLNPAQKTGAGASSSTNAGTVENPMPSGVSSMPNSTQQETSPEARLENLTKGVAMAAPKLFPAAPLWNFDRPCDGCNTPGCTTNNFGPTVNGLARKENQKQNFGHLSSSYDDIGGSSSASDPTRPSGNECPFSGMPMANDSSTPPMILHQISPFRRRFRDCNNDAVVGMFHRGIQCDVCGVSPIVGPRYKSKVREDYDLCRICFSDVGNETDYIRIDRPVPYRPPLPFRGLPHSNNWADTRIMGRWGKKATRGKLNSCFILDVNVVDGTMMAPSTHFTKIWRMRNNGSIAWPQGLQIVFIGGDRFSHKYSIDLEIPVDGIPVDGELDVAVDFTSPGSTGRYISYFRMASPSGHKFGERVWVLIDVDASMKDSVSDGDRTLNLNLPPNLRGSKCPEVMDANVQPVKDNGIGQPCNTTPTSELVPNNGILKASNAASTSVSAPAKPMVDVGQPKKNQELDFPINDSLLADNGGSNPASRQASTSASYPIIDLSEAASSFPAVPGVNAPTLPDEANAKDVVEKSLLKELEEMGFDQFDLNKEILRMNEYNLEQSVDDLCVVSGWDPILDELKEMGFRNEEMNRKLLKKNKGSIKGVVMDLLTGEKA